MKANAHEGSQPVNGQIGVGTTYGDRAPKGLLWFEARKFLKAWIKAEGVPHLHLNSRWGVAGEDLRKAMRAAAAAVYFNETGEEKTPAFVD